jgi:acetyl esterase/lipase
MFFFFYSLLHTSTTPMRKGYLIYGYGKAPSSERWDWAIQTDSTTFKNDPLVYNIVHPCLQFYPAGTAVANVMVVIICPGGGFYYLHISTEGEEVALRLNKKGVAAFVLQYRGVHCATNFRSEGQKQR